MDGCMYATVRLRTLNGQTPNATTCFVVMLVLVDYCVTLERLRVDFPSKHHLLTCDLTDQTPFCIVLSVLIY